MVAFGRPGQLVVAMVIRQFCRIPPSQQLLLLLASCLFIGHAYASYGDRLPEFQECVEVCKRENCVVGNSGIPLALRLLFWTCPAECDYTCQNIITEARVAAHQSVVQFHGKWPFNRFLGMQEPCSVLFSLFNFIAHFWGLRWVRTGIPVRYPLRGYYVLLAYIGMASWVFSMIFHTRDFALTEQLDYFAAGASVLYGLYYAPIRIFRLYQGGTKARSLMRAWTVLCCCLYAAHVIYLKWYSWNYTYNMAANVAVGILQNIMWSWFSVDRYLRSKNHWATWPGIVVAWVIVAMSLELLDFPPLWGCLDAHSLWHLGTVGPTIIWYNFLLKDAQDDIAGQRRLK